MNNWNSVKERLPEKDGFYLCTARWKKDMDFAVETLKYSTRICPTIPDWMKANVFANGGAFGEMWSDGLDNIEEVIAWQELPAPFNAEESEGNDNG